MENDYICFMIYNKIYDFCKVRNDGPYMDNGLEPTPRVKFLMELLDEVGIEYELDTWSTNPKTNMFNIIMRGTSDKFVVAHHDINNPNSDNANDNSASCINVIATKLMRPDVNAALLDGEEFGGKGSQRLSKQINAGDFGSIAWVLNYELTGVGGENFFIGNYPGPLFDKIKSIFNCPVIVTPFNDAVIFRGNGIDSVVINPCPILEGDKLMAHLNSIKKKESNFYPDLAKRRAYYETEEKRLFKEYMDQCKKSGVKASREDFQDFLDKNWITQPEEQNFIPITEDEVEVYIEKAKQNPQCAFNENGILDTSILYLCHSPADSVTNMSTSDMQSFVEKIVSKII